MGHPVLPPAGEKTLNRDGSLKDGFRQVDMPIGQMPPNPGASVLRMVACRVEDFEIDDRAGRRTS